ncbi:MAG: tetratricopeptide repeat protein [Hyphomicrobiales bacterium]|nr:tetratricopeptide repeat protein [Hyphomicrobiales bacterium]
MHPPQTVPQLYAQALQAQQTGHIAQAAKLYGTILNHQPGHIPSYHQLAQLLQQNGDVQAAIRLMEIACSHAPDHAQTYRHLGILLRLDGQHDAAEQCYQKALSLKPGDAATHAYYAKLLKDKGNLDEAVAQFTLATQHNTGNAAWFYDLANTLHDLGRFPEADRTYQRALTLQPEYAEAWYNYATTLFLTDQYDKAWDAYFWRHRLPNAPGTATLHPSPCWMGQELDGKTLLILSEQGVGDVWFFAHMLPDIATRAGCCILALHESRHIPLFNRSFDNIEVIETETITDISVDYHIALPDLGKYLRPVITSIPEQSGYLQACPEKTAENRTRYQALGKKTLIGIAWHTTNQENALQLARNIPLSHWAPILQLPDTQFISLQYGDHQEEIRAVEAQLGITIHTDTSVDALKSLDDFAAQVAALNRVISIDNATVHMAGALGIPTETLLPFVPNWRWGLGRNDCPWYPTMRLWRQPAPGNWEAPLRTLQECLLSE